eukprot:gnl/MRDRNA2_/MRDRNA2_27154_c0_seq1.p1 gnl/MRDRNA2_/MRDRNA2_27154_c0~~gnl/MRDRNA2_/MRDRNA2_27154_c0_seq1.p1  ORF type:complete len:466 (+),score=101.92 gnl/MRDRNA2_/MRDRNA2_27154_c0_seq1:233-1630(+)
MPPKTQAGFTKIKSNGHIPQSTTTPPPKQVSVTLHPPTDLNGKYVLSDSVVHDRPLYESCKGDHQGNYVIKFVEDQGWLIVDGHSSDEQYAYCEDLAHNPVETTAIWHVFCGTTGEFKKDPKGYISIANDSDANGSSMTLRSLPCHGVVPHSEEPPPKQVQIALDLGDDAEAQGTYFLTEKVVDGRPVYSRRDGDEEYLLRFLHDHGWMVHDKDCLEDHDVECYAYAEDLSHNPTKITAVWHVWCAEIDGWKIVKQGKVWIPQEGEKQEPGIQQGASSGKASVAVSSLQTAYEQRPARVSIRTERQHLQAEMERKWAMNAIDEASAAENKVLQLKQQRLEDEMEGLRKSDKTTYSSVPTVHDSVPFLESDEGTKPDADDGKKKQKNLKSNFAQGQQSQELEPYCSQDDPLEDLYIAEKFGPVMDDFILAVVQSLPEDGHADQDWLLDFMVKWLDAKSLDDDHTRI